MSISLGDVGQRLATLEQRHNRLQARTAVLEFAVQYLFTAFETDKGSKGEMRQGLGDIIEGLVAEANVSDELRAAALAEAKRWKEPSGHREGFLQNR